MIKSVEWFQDKHEFPERHSKNLVACQVNGLSNAEQLNKTSDR